MPVDQNTRQAQWRASLNMWRASTMPGPLPETTQARTHKAHTLSPRKKIKLSDPTGNRTRAVGLKGRAFAEYATAMDNEHLLINNMKGQWEEHISHIFHFFFQ